MKIKELFETGTFSAKISYKEWLKKNNLQHSPANTEKYKAEQAK